MTEEQIRTLMEEDPQQSERTLFEEYYSYVYAIAFRKISGTGTREDVEECVIDVFLEVLQRFPGIREGSLKAYIGTTAKNKALNVCRALSAKSRQTESIDDVNGLALVSGQDVAASAEQAELSRRLFGCIRDLGEPDAAIIIHKFFYGRSAGEIARILGTNPAQIRNRCSRALKRLRTALSDLW